MTNRSRLTGALIAALLTAATSRLAAQQPSAVSAPAPSPAETLVLSPFEVKAESQNGYMASTTLSATRTNEKLENLPNSISVLTSDLLRDINATDYFDAVEYAVGAQNTYSVGFGKRGAQNGELQGNVIRFRGIPSVRQLRDGIPWYITQDTFNTDRIEFSRGPGGLTYGDVDPGGIINIVSKHASFVRSTTVEGRGDSFGSRRATLDTNLPLIHNRVALRLNLVDSKNETSFERQSNGIQAVAGSVRIMPFKDGRTQLDISTEIGKLEDHLGHQPLADTTAAYVLGSGTNALDADPVRTGTQTNGVGMAQIAAAGARKVYWDIGGTVYNMQSTATTVYRYSITPTTVNVATGNDPQNPLLVPRSPAAFSLVPLGQDWAGPDMRQNIDYRSYTAELRHTFSDNFNVQVTANGQSDKLDSIQSFDNNNVFGGSMAARTLFRDVTPLLPSPTGTGTITNPHYQDYYVAYVPTKARVKHESQTWRSDAIYVLKLPHGITERIIGSTSYRDEKLQKDNYSYALSQSAIAARGFTGTAATYLNNLVYPIHYLKDGNSDAALAVREGPDVTYFRDDSTANNRFESSIWTSSISALGSYFDDRLHTSVGVSRTYWRQNMNRVVTADANGELQFMDAAGNIVSPEAVPLYAFDRRYTTNQSYGAVLRLLSWASASAGYFQSSLFADQPNDYGVSLLGPPVGARHGKGRDYSLRFDPLQGKVYATVTYYQTISENNYTNVSAGARNELNGLLATPSAPLITGSKDSYDMSSHGYEFELVGNPTPAWTLRATFSYNKTDVSNPYPILSSLIAQARTVATARGLDPSAATAVSQTFLDTSDPRTATFRADAKNASLAVRYNFLNDSLKGLVLGTTAQFQAGFPVTAQLQVGGVNVIAPYKTPDTITVNPFAAYGQKLKGGRSWEVRLSSNNVFDRVTNQGNNPNSARYTQPRKILFSAKISF